jgi:hypothetical protein
MAQFNTMSARSSAPASPLLRRALLGDALLCVASGALLTLGAGFLAGALGLPETLLRGVGLFLLPYAALVAYVGTRAQPSRALVWALIAFNLLWTLDSLVLLLSGWVAPTALGYAFVLVQALVVAAFAEAQFLGLRRSTADA